MLGGTEHELKRIASPLILLIFLVIYMFTSVKNARLRHRKSPCFLCWLVVLGRPFMQTHKSVLEKSLGFYKDFLL